MSRGTHIAYKLVRKMADGSLAPLFINKKMRFKTDGTWMQAEDVPTQGFAHRPGFHTVLRPEAPHLNEEGRTWIQVECRDWEYHDRPESQGGRWLLAQRMRVVSEL